ncbi:MAG: hypothetical protein FJ107_06535 [Deltaproteobacteria bacterium]|nr:hypothetical protein [Deltaproteobacteria bacterium]
MNQLIRCITCDEIFMKTPFDQWPEYDSVMGGVSESFRTIETDDFQVFLKHHQNHQTEALEVLEDSFVSEKPYSEPMKVSYFRATNGKEKFVVKKFRTKIDEPLTYQLIHGDYSLTLLRLEIQSKEIIGQLARELKTPSLSRPKVEAFLKVLRQVLKTVDIETLERIPEDSPHPLEVYYKMDEVSLAYLLRNCRSIFEGQEYKEIETFIHRHKEDGVLLLKATYQIQISEIVKSKKDVISIPRGLEERRYVEKK